MARTKRGRERRRSQPATPPAGAPKAPAATPRAYQGRQAAADARKRAAGPRERTVAAFRALRETIVAQPAAALVGAAIMLAALTLYVFTAARDIVFGDTPELTAVALTAGVAHPPGYPVFTVIGWVFGQLPVGPPPFRIALFSVVCHVLTVGVVYAATFRFTRSIPAAAVAACVLAFSPIFWVWSLVAEVFPLNDLLAVTMLLLVALWHEHPERRALFVAGGFVGGLGTANHQTILLLGPAVLYVMWLRRRVLLRDLTLVRNAAIAFGVGLLPYLALIVLASRHPEFSWTDIRGLSDLVAHILRKDYGTGSLIADPKFTGGSLVGRVVAIFTDVGPLFVVVFAIGAIYAWRVRQWYATYLLIAFAIAGPGFIAYSNAKIDEPTVQAVLARFFLMPYVTIAPLAGFAVLAFGALSERIALSRRVLETAVAGVVLAATVAIVALNYHDIDQSNNHVARTFAEDIFATIRPNAIFFGGGDPIVFTVQYMQAVEHVRPDVTVVGSPLLGAEWYVRKLRREHPDLVIKDNQYGGNAAPIRRLFDANNKRPLMAVGDLPDNSTKDVYYFVSHGIIYDVVPIEQSVSLEELTSQNEEILAQYRPSKYADLTGPYRTWERLTLVDYSLGYYRVGREWQLAGDSLKDKQPARAAELYATARRWYERSLAILPTLVESRAGLSKLPQ